MNNRWILYLLAFAAILIIAGALTLTVLNPSGGTTTTPTSTGATTTPAATSTFPILGIADLIVITAPTSGAQISSPLTITGAARGTWYFEASFPVELRDDNGELIAQVPGQALSEWMTADFVPFKATIIFPKQPAGSKGTLIIRNDNPSGDPARDKKVEIPITFK